MTKDKALKRDVRARMAKTGEAYTTARHFLLDQHLQETVAQAEPEPAPALPPRVAEPGMSDDAIQRSTGRTWDEYFVRLDAWGVAERSHPEIATFVAEEFGLSGWWSQNVTVGYERARGLRKVNQLVDGFSVSVSRTFPVPVEALYDGVADDQRRAAWLEPDLIRVRNMKPNKAWRCEMTADGTRVEFAFTAKSPEKSSLTIQHTRLSDESDVTAQRAFWKERLDRLARSLDI